MLVPRDVTGVDFPGLLKEVYPPLKFSSEASLLAVRHSITTLARLENDVVWGGRCASEERVFDYPDASKDFALDSVDRAWKCARLKAQVSKEHPLSKIALAQARFVVPREPQTRIQHQTFKQ